MAQLRSYTDVGSRFVAVQKQSADDIIRSVYYGHNHTIANCIVKNFQTISGKSQAGEDVVRVSILDVGGGAGALTLDLRQRLKEVSAGDSVETFELLVTNVDPSEELLAQDTSSNFQVAKRFENCDASDFRSPENPEGKFDLILMRYVLHYNPLDIQEVILQRISSMLAANEESIFIFHHCGVRDEIHRQRFQQMCSDPNAVSQKMVRKDGCCWRSWTEVLGQLTSLKLSVDVLEDYELPIGMLFAERYALSPEEVQKLANLLGEYQYIHYIIAVIRYKM